MRILLVATGMAKMLTDKAHLVQIEVDIYTMYKGASI